MKRLAVALMAVLLALPALAVNPDEILADPVLEARARDISAGLRCLVCQNESIDESNADLAREIRIIVRERLLAGDTDEQAIQYLVDRYGEYILLRPVVAPHTILLWSAAPVVLIIGGVGIFLATRRKRRLVVEPETLTADEQRALDELDSGRA